MWWNDIKRGVLSIIKYMIENIFYVVQCLLRNGIQGGDGLTLGLG